MLCVSIHQSRSVSNSWKKSSSCTLYTTGTKQNTAVNPPNYAGAARYGNTACLCYSPQLLSNSAKSAYVAMRTKCHQCLNSVSAIPTRFISYKRPWDSLFNNTNTQTNKAISALYEKPDTANHKTIHEDYVMNYASHTLGNHTGRSSNQSFSTAPTKQNIVLPQYSFSSNMSLPSENDLKDDKSKLPENLNDEEETETLSQKESDVENPIVKHSQYDHLISSVKKQQEAEQAFENTILSSLKSMVEAPMNSFISLLSRANLFERADEKKANQKKGQGELEGSAVVHSSANKIKNETIPKEETPLSLLDSLYQYVPYVFSSSATSAVAQDKEAQKKTSNIQADRNQLGQRVSINNRTRYLIQCIKDTNSMLTLSQRVEELKDHLMRFPDTRITAVKENAIREIMHIYRTTYDKDLIPVLRVTLAMLGAVDPPKRKGIRILTIDGGGCRGVLSVEIFRRLVELSGQPIHEMFDYICGVSTGAILGFLLGLKKVPIDSLGPMYRSFSSQVFDQNRLVGTGKLVISHAFYNTETYQKVLKETMGSTVLIETAGYEDTPKCAAVSTLVNRMVLKPYVWRNYSIVPGTRHTHWPGTCRGKVWEAVRASSAAPGYFEEFKKGPNIHQDGGLLTNNPTGVALNECSLLWPHSPIQCVVSVGTGRYEPTVGPTGDHFLSLKDKLLKVVDSATSVSEVHTVMYDLLPPHTYFRFNPFMREPLLLDDYHPDKLDLLVEDAHEYIARNEHKFQACVDTLLGKKAHKTR
nr:calcium-independent phospholipase A2-gamma-like [Ciona intestinalis]|eukprot:XP_026695112.1 calcium-independent phospholipase A2-gamma-like [Ciona intestinalis]